MTSMYARLHASLGLSGFTSAQIRKLAHVAQQFGFTAENIIYAIMAASLRRRLTEGPATVLDACNQELGIQCEDVRPASRRREPEAEPDFAAVGLGSEEIQQLCRVAHRVRATPAKALGGVVRVALGLPFREGSLAYRLVDACNEIDATHTVGAS